MSRYLKFNGINKAFELLWQTLRHKLLMRLSMHSSKGLEFLVVLIPGIGFMPDQYGHGTPEEEARLLYVAMTRAIEQLILISEAIAPQNLPVVWRQY